MNTGLKLAIVGGGLAYLFRSQIAALFSKTAPASAAAVPAVAPSSSASATASRASKLEQAAGATSLSWDAWAWYWQNAAGLGVISPAQMDGLLNGSDRSQSITALAFAGAAAKEGL